MSGHGDGVRRLVVLRHAQAEHGSMSDELRPLTLHGRRQSAGVGAALGAAGLLPETVLVSTAVRARQTWEILRSAMGDVPQPEVVLADALYDASPGDVTAMVRALDARVRTVLVVGHEPTMSGLATVLASPQTSVTEALSRVHAGLHTAAYAVLEIAVWADLAPGSALLREVVRPAR
ncbi:MAG TPA: histidine phosphatase family protein [Actinotalea sp.]